MIPNQDTYNDDKLKTLLAGSKLAASENLQHRIMQQIMTEKALSPHKLRSAKPTLRVVVTMAIAMYCAVMALGLYTYFTAGFKALSSPEFLISLVAISSICAVCGLVAVLDERRYQR